MGYFNENQHNTYLNNVADEFVMELGVNVLQDIDTPSFMRKALKVEMVNYIPNTQRRRIVEPDEKIVKFLTVLKRKDMATNIG